VKRAAVLVCLLATPARADSSDIVSRSIVLPRGALAAELTVEANLAYSYKAAPLSLAPDLWWGATDALTLGLVHSNASLDRFDPGASVCVRTDDVLYCDSAYHGSGLDARYRVADDGAFELAPRARVLVRDTDPFKPALTIGALGIRSAATARSCGCPSSSRSSRHADGSWRCRRAGTASSMSSMTAGTFRSPSAFGRARRSTSMSARHSDSRPCLARRTRRSNASSSCRSAGVSAFAPAPTR
jgi:hypothetical protein